MSDFQYVAAELSRAVNRASAENGSNTPDYVLGEFLAGVLEAFHAAVRARDEHSSYTLVCGTMRSAKRLAEVEQLVNELAEVRRLRKAVEDVATAYERIDGGTETVKVYAADVAAKIRAAIAGEVAGDE